MGALEWPSGKQRHISQKESLGHIDKDLNAMLRKHLLSDCILGTICELLEWEFQALEKRDGHLATPDLPKHSLCAGHTQQVALVIHGSLGAAPGHRAGYCPILQ